MVIIFPEVFAVTRVGSIDATPSPTAVLVSVTVGVIVSVVVAVTVSVAV